MPFKIYNRHYYDGSKDQFNIKNRIPLPQSIKKAESDRPGFEMIAGFLLAF